MLSALQSTLTCPPAPPPPPQRPVSSSHRAVPEIPASEDSGSCCWARSFQAPPVQPPPPSKSALENHRLWLPQLPGAPNHPTSPARTCAAPSARSIRCSGTDDLVHRTTPRPPQHPRGPSSEPGKRILQTSLRDSARCLLASFSGV